MNVSPTEQKQPKFATQDCLIVFTRYPQPGQTKTRLIPTLGTEGAASLQRQMTEHTLSQVELLQIQHPVTIEIRFVGGSHRQMRRWLGSKLTYRRQGKGDLGDRMQQAFGTAFANGQQHVAIVGSDCPELNASLLKQTFEMLKNNDLVLGPASDGGYYLIGLRRSIPELFQNIHWGTERVFQQTLDIAHSLRLAIGELPVLDDIDRPEDLPRWETIQQQYDTTPKISVIIPVLNEATTLEKTLNSLQNAVNVEVIVVDGGSNDRSTEIAANRGVRVISSPPGRSRQMNAGAAIATGEILLFLHSDTQLPQGFDPQVRLCVHTPETVAGAFALKIDGEDARLRAIETFVKWRSHLLQLPYGDQAIFLRKQRFLQMGGFPNLPIMEDFELIRQLQRHGQIRILPTAVLTSPRRWQKLGIWKTTAINQLVIIGYFLGISPTALAHWYRSERRWQ